MPTLLCLGLGYCARYYVAEFGSRFDRIIGTSRTPKPAGRVEMLAFDGGVAVGRGARAPSRRRRIC